MFRIYAPKGTHATYLEPISAYGNVAKRGWDGISKQSRFCKEDETLFQRGARMRITKVTKEKGKYIIECDIIGQDVRDLSCVNPKHLRP
ncbi:MAG: ADP-ribosyltransferase [Marinilabiliaceae bacterium]